MLTLRYLTLSLALSLAFASRAANMTPISVTGFKPGCGNREQLIGSAVPPTALELNPGENTAFYQSGLPGTTYGLPTKRNFSAAPLAMETVFQFQPYTGNNALVLSSETGLTSGTLTLTCAGPFTCASLYYRKLGQRRRHAERHIEFQRWKFLRHQLQRAGLVFSTPGLPCKAWIALTLTSGAAQGGPNDPRFYQTYHRSGCAIRLNQQVADEHFFR